MPERTVYEKLVLRTFSERALRTALLIDDQFPTYVDLLEGREEEFSDADRAARLYRQLKGMHLPCDVVNRVTSVGGLMEDVERIRKSDLIILDYHLTPRSEDSTLSTELLARLADTKHFNTVVLYTRERDLRRVWRDVACRLRGGWVAPETLLADNDDALAAWETLVDGDDVPEPPVETIEGHAVDARETREAAGKVFGAFGQELKQRGVHAKMWKPITDALVHREMIRRFGAPGQSLKRPVYGRFRTDPDVIWLQCANCFIAIARKALPTEIAVPPADAGGTGTPETERHSDPVPQAPDVGSQPEERGSAFVGASVDGSPAVEALRGDEGSVPEGRMVHDAPPVAAAASPPPASQVPLADVVGGTDPEGIIACLEMALLDWRPSFVRIVLSEVQNLLELEALGTQDATLRDPDIHVGLSYYVLAQLRGAEAPWSSVDLTPTVRNIVDRIVEGIRRRISSDIELEGTVAELLAHELDASGWPAAVAERTSDATWKAAAQLGRYETAPNNRRSLLRLNTFLSTEPFRRLHVSTGTVFRERGTEDFWVCVSPACDMVPRNPGPDQRWLWALHPMRPMLVIRLQCDPPGKGLDEAERGWHVFLDLGGAEPHAYKVLHGTSAVPAYEMLFPMDAGRVTRDTHAFEAYSLRSGRSTTVAATVPPAFAVQTYEVVAQLRPPYANRVLQFVGQHLSRIGVDFVSSRDDSGD